MTKSTRTDKKLFENLHEVKSNSGTNIIVAGQTGVGKSTLINAIFKRDVAKTSVGASVTSNITGYELVGTSVTLFDTRGLEIDKYKETVKELRAFVEKRQKNSDPNNLIHIAWVCILESSNRLQEGDKAVVEMLKKYMKVIIVMCQSISADDSFISTVKTEFPDLDVITVLAKEKHLRGNRLIPAIGLEQLTDCTIAAVPEAHEKVLIAAQNQQCHII